MIQIIMKCFCKFVNLLYWVKIKTVGELGDGSHYCQFMDMMFPGKMNLFKNPLLIFKFKGWDITGVRILIDMTTMVQSCAQELFDKWKSKVSEKYKKVYLMVKDTILMRKVKWNPSQENDKISNFKIMQEAFKRLNIDRVSSKSDDEINNIIKSFNDVF